MSKKFFSLETYQFSITYSLLALIIGLSFFKFSPSNPWLHYLLFVILVTTATFISEYMINSRFADKVDHYKFMRIKYILFISLISYSLLVFLALQFISL